MLKFGKVERRKGGKEERRNGGMQNAEILKCGNFEIGDVFGIAVDR